MDTTDIAQAVLDKARSVTMSSRHGELRDAFQRAGIEITEDCAKVVSVSEDAAFQKLSAELKSSMPTALIGAKRVLHENDIDV